MLTTTELLWLFTLCFVFKIYYVHSVRVKNTIIIVLHNMQFDNVDFKIG